MLEALQPSFEGLFSDEFAALPFLDDAAGWLLAGAPSDGADGSGADGSTAAAAAAEGGSASAHPWRCLDGAHDPQCTRCTPAPSALDAETHELVGDPGKRNGEKKLKAALILAREWHNQPAREAAAAAAEAAGFAPLAEALRRKRATSLRKGELFFLLHLWRYSSDLWHDRTDPSARHKRQRVAAPAPAQQQQQPQPLQLEGGAPAPQSQAQRADAGASSAPRRGPHAASDLIAASLRSLASAGSNGICGERAYAVLLAQATAHPPRFVVRRADVDQVRTRYSELLEMWGIAGRLNASLSNPLLLTSTPGDGSGNGAGGGAGGGAVGTSAACRALPVCPTTGKRPLELLLGGLADHLTRMAANLEGAVHQQRGPIAVWAEELTSSFRSICAALTAALCLLSELWAAEAPAVDYLSNERTLAEWLLVLLGSVNGAILRRLEWLSELAARAEAAQARGRLEEGAELASRDPGAPDDSGAAGGHEGRVCPNAGGSSGGGGQLGAAGGCEGENDGDGEEFDTGMRLPIPPHERFNPLSVPMISAGGTVVAVGGPAPAALFGAAAAQSHTTTLAGAAAAAGAGANAGTPTPANLH